MAAENKRELWVNWTHDAMRRYVMPDEIDDADDLVDDMAEVATKFANQMLDNYEEQFDGNSSSTRRSPRRRRGEEEQPEE